MKNIQFAPDPQPGDAAPASSKKVNPAVRITDTNDGTQAFCRDRGLSRSNLRETRFQRSTRVPLTDLPTRTKTHSMPTFSLFPFFKE